MDLRIINQLSENGKNVKALCVLIIGLVVSLTAFCFLHLHQVKTQYSVRQFLPKNDPLMTIDEKVKETFNLAERPGFLVTIKLSDEETGTWLVPERVAKLERATLLVAQYEGIGGVHSIANVEGAADMGNGLTTGPILKLISPGLWWSRVHNDPLLSPTLISQDGRTVMLNAEINELTVRRMSEIQDKLYADIHGIFPASIIRVGGVPAIQADVGSLLLKELKNFLLLGVFACTLILLLIFSNWTGVAIPLLIMICCNVVVLGGFALAGISFTILSSTLPILVSITVVAMATHTMHRFDEEWKDSSDRNLTTKFKYALQTLRVLFLPNLLAALTTCIGFLTLAVNQVPSVRQYGLMVAGSVMVAWILTNLMLVPLLTLLPVPTVRPWTNRRARWSLYVSRFGRPITIVIALMTLFLAWRGLSLNWSPKLFDDLPRLNQARQSTEQIDQKLGGIIPLEIVIHAGRTEAWNDPKLVGKLEKILKKIRLNYGVGSAIGLPDFLRAAHIGRQGILPMERKAVAETYFLYSLAENNPLRTFLSTDGSTTRLGLRLRDIPAQSMSLLIGRLVTLAKSEFPHFEVKPAGMATTAHVLNEELSKSLIFGFWQALLIIGVLLILIFRSLRWAIVACLPNLIPPAAMIGILALTHTPIKPGIALIFSIALGLAFNNTVYLLTRLRHIQESFSRACVPVRQAFYRESNSCMVSTMVVFAGFTVFLASYFSLNRLFGAYMLLSIVGGFVGDLIFLPALLKFFPGILGTNKPVEVKVFSPGKESALAKSIIASVFVLFFSFSAEASLLKAGEILKKAEEQITSRDESANVQLRIIESDGSSKSRALVIKRKSGAKHRVLVKLRSPPDLRGTALLSVSDESKDDQWLFLPSSKQTRRIVGGNRQSGFLGSELSYEDLSASGARGAQTKVLREEQIEGKKYSVIEALPKPENSSYGRVLSWIGQDNYLAKKAEYYDKRNQLMKVISFDNYRKFGGSVWRAQVIRVQNVQNKRGTELTLTDLKVNEGIADDAFSIQAMEQD